MNLLEIYRITVSENNRAVIDEPVKIISTKSKERFIVTYKKRKRINKHADVWLSYRIISSEKLTLIQLLMVIIFNRIIIN